MKLSFVIPAHNEAAYIADTIGAIRESMQNIAVAYEIIVAADGCTDATIGIAESLGARVVAHERRQIAATRNLGARAASGDVLLFVDADTRVSDAAIAGVLRLIQSGAVGGGAPFRIDGPLPRYARTLLPLLTGVFWLANLTGGAFLYCTREAFDRVGGFDEQYFAAEEIHLARALKRLGRFRLIRTPVHTSGRKMRTHTGRELFMLFFRGILRPSSLKDRESLDFFYGPRRNDPHAR